MISLLDNKQFPDNKKVIFAIKLKENLHKLDLNKVPLTEQKLTELLNACTRLKKLNLACCYPLPEGSFMFKTMEWVYSTAYVFFTKNNSPISKYTRLTAESCCSLTELNLAKFPFTEGKLIEILVACKNLRSLNSPYAPRPVFGLSQSSGVE